MSFLSQKKGMDLVKIGGLLLLIMTLVIVFIPISDIIDSTLGSVYKSTVDECELQENLAGPGMLDDPRCNPVNCDNFECSDSEESRWDGLVRGFESTSCYEDKDNCETQFEQRMYDLVHEEDEITSPPEDFNYQDFYQKTQEVAQNVGIETNHLLAVMAFETGGTYHPCQKNLAGSSATGLIQFTEATANDLGTSTNELCEMSSIEQLDYVEQYFLTVKQRQEDNFKFETLGDVYLGVLCPAALKTNIVAVDKTRNIDQEGACDLSDSNMAYELNSGLDREGTGIITQEDAVQSVKQHLVAIETQGWENTVIS